MISILSLVTSIKDYIEIVHKLIETDNSFGHWSGTNTLSGSIFPYGAPYGGNNSPMSPFGPEGGRWPANYFDLGSIITYTLISFKEFFTNLSGFGPLALWEKFNNRSSIWDLAIIIPDINSAMISEISVLDGFFHNTFNFLDKPISPSNLLTQTATIPGQSFPNFLPEGPLWGSFATSSIRGEVPEVPSAVASGLLHPTGTDVSYLVGIGEGVRDTNITIYSLEKFSIGLINSIFLCLPTGTTHLITLRRFVMQGLEAGYLAGLGSICGNILWISSIIFGWRFFVIPWLSLDIFRYLLGFICLIKYMWDSYNEKKMLELSPSDKGSSIPYMQSKEEGRNKDKSLVRNQKIFLLNFLLALTEQTSIYPFITNISIGPESSLLESFPAQNNWEFLSIHGSYILGLILGCLSLLHFACWFWENPAFKFYMWLDFFRNTPNDVRKKGPLLPILDRGLSSNKFSLPTINPYGGRDAYKPNGFLFIFSSATSFLFDLFAGAWNMKNNKDQNNVGNMLRKKDSRNPDGEALGLFGRRNQGPLWNGFAAYATGKDGLGGTLNGPSGFYKVLNFIFLYLTMICAISSIPYYGLDYTLTNPLGFVQEDRILDQKLILETSFLNTKASDRNTRRNRGRHGRRERWKRRIRKYRTFDASLYDQGIYDLFTIEDLNYGFDRFWLRRKMRNHRVRFRFFPGPWMRSFKKQLAKPRLESYAGPRQEFFRILFEQVYHPSFHEYLNKNPNGPGETPSEISTNEARKKLPFFFVVPSGAEAPRLQHSEHLQGRKKEHIPMPFFSPAVSPRGGNIPGLSHPGVSKEHSQHRARKQSPTLNLFVPPLPGGGLLFFPASLQSIEEERKTGREEGSLKAFPPLLWDMREYQGKPSDIAKENSTLRKFIRKINNRTNISKIISTPSNLFRGASLTFGEKKVLQGIIPSFSFSLNINNNSLYSKRWKEKFSKISHELAYYPLKRKISPGPHTWLHTGPHTGTLFSGGYKKENSKISISKLDKHILMYRSRLVVSDINGFAGSDPLIFSKRNSKKERAPSNLTNNNSLYFLHPLKFYLKKQQAFERKLRYYTPTIFRKFSIENNAPYFRVMMKRYFYYYKPTLRWERTMKVASLRKARRKTPVSARKIQFSGELRSSSFPLRSLDRMGYTNYQSGSFGETKQEQATLLSPSPSGVRQAPDGEGDPTPSQARSNNGISKAQKTGPLSEKGSMVREQSIIPSSPSFISLSQGTSGDPEGALLSNFVRGKLKDAEKIGDNSLTPTLPEESIMQSKKKEGSLESKTRSQKKRTGVSSSLFPLIAPLRRGPSTYSPLVNIEELKKKKMEQQESKDSISFSSSRVIKATHNFTIVGKRASRFRYEIYKDVLQHWYYSTFNRLLLKFDIDLFINRQPKSHFLTKNEEKLLHLRRFLLSEHYNTLRWYSYMQHYRSMKAKIGGTKSFASKVYNQQFSGTFKKIRHLFAITPSQSDQSVLKFDQPLYKESTKKYLANNKSLSPNEVRGNRKLVFHNTSLPLEIFHEELYPIKRSFGTVSDTGVDLSSGVALSRINLSQSDSRLRHSKRLDPRENSFELFGGAALTFGEKSKAKKEEDGHIPKPIFFVGRRPTPGLPHPVPTGYFSRVSRLKLPGDLLNQSTQIVGTYIKKTNSTKQYYIKNLLKNKKYLKLTQFLYKGQKTRGLKPITNERRFLSQEKEYLLKFPADVPSFLEFLANVPSELQKRRNIRKQRSYPELQKRINSDLSSSMQLDQKKTQRNNLYPSFQSPKNTKADTVLRRFLTGPVGVDFTARKKSLEQNLWVNLLMKWKRKINDQEFLKTFLQRRIEKREKIKKKREKNLKTKLERLENWDVKALRIYQANLESFFDPDRGSYPSSVLPDRVDLAVLQSNKEPDAVALSRIDLSRIDSGLPHTAGCGSPGAGKKRSLKQKIGHRYMPNFLPEGVAPGSFWAGDPVEGCKIGPSFRKSTTGFQNALIEGLSILKNAHRDKPEGVNAFDLSTQGRNKVLSVYLGLKTDFEEKKKAAISSSLDSFAADFSPKVKIAKLKNKKRKMFPVPSPSPRITSSKVLKIWQQRERSLNKQKRSRKEFKSFAQRMTPQTRIVRRLFSASGQREAIAELFSPASRGIGIEPGPAEPAGRAGDLQEEGSLMAVSETFNRPEGPMGGVFLPASSFLERHPQDGRVNKKKYKKRKKRDVPEEKSQSTKLSSPVDFFPVPFGEVTPEKREGQNWPFSFISGLFKGNKPNTFDPYGGLGKYLLTSRLGYTPRKFKKKKSPQRRARTRRNRGVTKKRTLSDSLKREFKNLRKFDGLTKRVPYTNGTYGGLGPTLLVPPLGEGSQSPKAYSLPDPINNGLIERVRDTVSQRGGSLSPQAIYAADVSPVSKMQRSWKERGGNYVSKLGRTYVDLLAIGKSGEVALPQRGATDVVRPPHSAEIVGPVDTWKQQDVSKALRAAEERSKGLYEAMSKIYVTLGGPSSFDTAKKTADPEFARPAYPSGGEKGVKNQLWERLPLRGNHSEATPNEVRNKKLGIYLCPIFCPKGPFVAELKKKKSGLFKQNALLLQRRSKQKKQRFWKQKRSKYSQKLRKYKKRRRSVLGKVRILTKQLKRIQSTIELKNWWWKNFLPNLRATTDSLLQLEKDRQIEQKLLELTVPEILERDKVYDNFFLSSLGFASMPPRTLRQKNSYSTYSLVGAPNFVRGPEGASWKEHLILFANGKINTPRKKLKKKEGSFFRLSAYPCECSFFSGVPNEVRKKEHSQAAQLPRTPKKENREQKYSVLEFPDPKGPPSGGKKKTWKFRRNTEANAKRTVPNEPGATPSFQLRLGPEGQKNGHIPMPIFLFFSFATAVSPRGGNIPGLSQFRRNNPEGLLTQLNLLQIGDFDFKPLSMPASIKLRNPLVGNETIPTVITQFTEVLTDSGSNNIPFYAGWDESLRKFVVTNRLLSRRTSGYEIYNSQGFASTPSSGEASFEAKKVNKKHKIGVLEGSLEDTGIRGILAKIKDLWYGESGEQSKEKGKLYQNVLTPAKQAFKPVIKLHMAPDEDAIKKYITKDSQDMGTHFSSANLKSFSVFDSPWYSYISERKVFSEAPLKGMNAATTLYWQIPFTTYDPDQFFALGMDGFAPLGWRRFQFRHSILKSWLKINDLPTKEGIELLQVPRGQVGSTRGSVLRIFPQAKKSNLRMFLRNSKKEDETFRTKLEKRGQLQGFLENKKEETSIGSVLPLALLKSMNFAKFPLLSNQVRKKVVREVGRHPTKFRTFRRDRTSSSISRNFFRRLKKRYKRVKKHPRSPVWFPSGPLLNQVLPVHYIYIFYKRSRLPRDRYIKRRLRKSKTILKDTGLPQRSTTVMTELNSSGVADLKRLSKSEPAREEPAGSFLLRNSGPVAIAPGLSQPAGSYPAGLSFVGSLPEPQASVESPQKFSSPPASALGKKQQYQRYSTKYKKDISSPVEFFPEHNGTSFRYPSVTEGYLQGTIKDFTLRKRIKTKRKYHIKPDFGISSSKKNTSGNFSQGPLIPRRMKFIGDPEMFLVCTPEQCIPAGVPGAIQKIGHIPMPNFLPAPGLSHPEVDRLSTIVAGLPHPDGPESILRSKEEDVAKLNRKLKSGGGVATRINLGEIPPSSQEKGNRDLDLRVLQGKTRSVTLGTFGTSALRWRPLSRQKINKPISELIKEQRSLKYKQRKKNEATANNKQSSNLRIKQLRRRVQRQIIRSVWRYHPRAGGFVWPGDYLKLEQVKAPKLKTITPSAANKKEARIIGEDPKLRPIPLQENPPDFPSYPDLSGTPDLSEISRRWKDGVGGYEKQKNLLSPADISRDPLAPVRGTSSGVSKVKRKKKRNIQEWQIQPKKFLLEKHNINAIKRKLEKANRSNKIQERIKEINLILEGKNL